MGKERRKYKRIDANMRVRFHSTQDLFLEYTKNISIGGMFLQTDHKLDPNATVNMDVEFPSNAGTFKVSGQVVRLMSLSHPTDPEKQIYGVGIRFIDPIPEMTAAIEAMIAMDTSGGS